MAFEQLATWLGAGTPPDGWQSITARPTLILVGVTGVGKSTTVAALAEAGLSFALLPNRRTLTDRLMISWLQARDGQPVKLVTDREERFAYTRRYRDLWPGGMAHTLTQLWINPQTQNATKILFDGLRGENEVSHAATLLPEARFVVLDAPHFVRIQRLLGRNDYFDQIGSQASSPSKEKNSLADLAGLEKDAAYAQDPLFTPEQEQALLALTHTGAVTTADLGAKLRIVLAERRNYDPAAALAALNRLAPDRTIAIDTTQYPPEAVAQLVLRRLADL